MKKSICMVLSAILLCINIAGCSAPSPGQSSLSGPDSQSTSGSVSAPSSASSASLSSALVESSQPAASGESQVESSGAAEGPTEEELEKLFRSVMHEIQELAYEDSTYVIGQIFGGDIEFDYDDRVTFDHFEYIRTTRQYSEMENYYGHFFTGEALDWIMSTKFLDVDGVLYLWKTGGATLNGCGSISIENLQGNTYQATWESSIGEHNTVFTVQKTDAGYRVSSIDYCPDLLDREVLKERMGLE
jgi:hypothetical protein